MYLCGVFLSAGEDYADGSHVTLWIINLIPLAPAVSLHSSLVQTVRENESCSFDEDCWYFQGTWNGSGLWSNVCCCGKQGYCNFNHMPAQNHFSPYANREKWNGGGGGQFHKYPTIIAEFDPYIHIMIIMIYTLIYISTSSLGEICFSCMQSKRCLKKLIQNLWAQWANFMAKRILKTMSTCHYTIHYVTLSSTKYWHGA